MRLLEVGIVLYIIFKFGGEQKKKSYPSEKEIKHIIPYWHQMLLRADQQI